MKKQVFDIDKFNIIQDEENYYFFRALNNADHSDIVNNITTGENGIERIRTDRERYEEENGTAKYNAESEISLEEVWNHIKVRYSKETNCISLSSNANVSIDYGQGYNEEYVMVKVPKQDRERVYNAGQYMLQEINSKIEEELRKIPQDSEIWEIIRKIDSEESSKNVKAIVADAYEGVKRIEGRFYEKDNHLKSKTSIVSRLDRRQYFSEEQQLEYNKIIAKLTVLETRGRLRSIIPTKIDNSSLIGTVGIAFSSGELIHYKDIQSNDMVQVPKEMMDILSITQQLKDKGIRDDAIKSLEERILELIKSGYKFSRQEEQLVLENGENAIPVKELDNSILQAEAKELQLKVEDVYQVTKGKISYEKAKIAIKFANKLSRSRLKAIEYADIIQLLTDGNEELAKVIKEECYVIDKDIISRENNEGHKIAESVNIGLSQEERIFISNKEQLVLIRAIQGLGLETLQEIVNTNGLSIESHIFDNLLDKNEEISENQYFAEAIVDGIDFGKIYKTTTGEKRIMTEEEKQLLVNKLMSADCKRLYNSFINAGISPNDISGYVVNILMNNGYKGHSLEELSQLENLDEIIDVNVKNRNLKNRIQALRMDKLLGIEDDAHIVPETEIRLRDYQQAAIDNINEIYKNKRFASVILPTGAGKSFVAMAEMMNFKDSNIIFIAPQTTILTQFQNHIIKNILKRKDVPIKDYSKVIEEVFPHLKTFCYETLGVKDEEWLASHDADFIILDELHRSGANTWQPQIQKLIDGNPKAKILGMTATPVRDADHKDMSRGLAEMTGEYTTDELIRKEHQAAEMTLLDAMQDELVVSPKVVTFDYNLGETEQYQQIKEMISEEKDAAKKEKLKQIYKEMTAIIKKSEKQGMNKILADNIKKKDGRYIVFLPNNNTELSTEQYMQQEIEKVKGYFKDIDPEPEISYLLSGRKDAKKENAKALETFEKSDSEHLKLIFAIDMLNEGVHVDNINGAVMLRPISENSKILYQQQIGRCVFSLNPDKPIADEDRPIIFDVYNNYLAQNMDREANKTNSTSDLQRLQAIVNWINNHKGYFPDINSENIKEARKAITLKNIQRKYSKYINGINNKNLSESELYEIQRIIELGKQIELWDLEIPDRINTTDEKDIIRNNTFKVSGTQKEFMDLFKKAKTIQKGRKNSDNLRIKETLTLLDILSEYGIEISNDTINFESELMDILSNVPNIIKKEILEEIEESDIDINENYKIGEEYNYAKEAFYDGKSIFTQYDVRDLRKCGIFEEFIRTKSTAKEKPILNTINKGEFIENGCKEFIGINIRTGTIYNEEGYDMHGRDEYRIKKGEKVSLYHFGNNMHYYIRDENGDWIDTGEIENPYGFRFDETYKDTGKKEDDYGFRIDMKHKDTLTYWDNDGFSINGVNEDDFGRNGNYFEKREDGKWYDTGSKLNPQNLDINGDYWEQNEAGEMINTHTKFGKDGYSLYGINEDGFGRNKRWYDIDKKTGKPIRKDGALKDRFGCNFYGVNDFNFGRNGNYFEKREDGKWYDTGSKLNPQNLDKNGDYWERNEKGELINTHSKFGKDGYSLYGISEYGFDKKDQLWYDVNKNTGKPISQYGRTQDKFGHDFNGINKFGFGLNGNYFEKRKDGKWYDTGSKLNPQNLDINGDYWKTNEKRELINTHSKFGEDGYSLYGINEHGFAKKDNRWYDVDKNTGKPIMEYGTYKDRFGHGSNGVNEFGFGFNGNYYILTQNGKWKDTGKKLNPQNLDKNGDYWERNEKGEWINTRSKFGKNGYSLYGINKNGFTIRRYWYGVDLETGKPIHDKGTRVDSEGYDFDGLDENKRGRDGHYYEKQKDGTLKDISYQIFQDEEFDYNGINIFQFGKNGNYFEKMEDGKWHDTGSKLNPQNLDINGDYWEQNEKGELVNTHTKFGNDGFSLYEINEDGFSKEDKLWYDVDIETGKPINTTGKEFDDKNLNFDRFDSEGYNEQGRDSYNFDKQGYYHEKQEDGTYKNTGLKYNPQGFNKDRRHRITGTTIDLRKFDINGKCKANNDSIYDKNGYKQDGTYMETGEMYHNGYNAFGVDEKGLDKTGREPKQITFAKEYIAYILKFGKKGMDYVIDKHCPRTKTKYILEEIKSYEIRKGKFIRENLGTAELMYPALKKLIAIKILTLRKEVIQRENKIRELEAQKGTGQKELEELRRMNSEQKEKLECLGQTYNSER